MLLSKLILTTMVIIVDNRSCYNYTILNDTMNDVMYCRMDMGIIRCVQNYCCSS